MNTILPDILIGGDSVKDLWEMLEKLDTAETRGGAAAEENSISEFLG